jgi:hypothetical protein
VLEQYLVEGYPKYKNMKNVISFTAEGKKNSLLHGQVWFVENRPMNIIIAKLLIQKSKSSSKILSYYHHAKLRVQYMPLIGLRG